MRASDGRKEGSEGMMKLVGRFEWIVQQLETDQWIFN